MLVRAYAKINLGLRILSKRPDGYHNIETVFHPVDVFDEISLEVSTSMDFKSSHPDVPHDESNLCMRAARELQRRYSATSTAKIVLSKKIPVGAGLGGGSSDAAATLIGLCKLWNVNPDRTDLPGIAITLGADVPYFLHNGTASATGRGEQLEYFPLDMPYALLLVHPNIHVSTAWAYAHSSPAAHVNEESLVTIWREHIAEPDRLQHKVRNDFESLVFREYPEIERLRNELYEAGAVFVQLSGSGSTVYGLFLSLSEAGEAADLFDSRYQTFVTPPHFSVPSDQMLA